MRYRIRDELDILTLHNVLKELGYIYIFEGSNSEPAGTAHHTNPLQIHVSYYSQKLGHDKTIPLI